MLTQRGEQWVTGTERAIPQSNLEGLNRGSSLKQFRGQTQVVFD